MALFPSRGGILELEQAVEELEQQQRDANPSTYALMLDWCVKLGALEAGKRIHRHSMDCGMRKNRFVENLLINMYGKCGDLEEAQRILEGMEDSNVFSWTIMLAAYAQNGYLDDALECFCKMELEGVRANRVTLISALGSCNNFSRAQWLHSRIKQEGFLPDDVMIQNALVSLYGRCCEVEQARSVFDEIRSKDLVSWTAMISAFVQNGHPDRAKVCFWSMQAEGIKPCRVTFTTILDAVMETRDRRVCEQIHLLIVEIGLEKDGKLLNLLVRSYGKCGDMEKMIETFEKLDEKNVVSWSGTIAAFSQNGYSWEAIEQLQKMDLEGVKANEVTFVSILDACAWTDISFSSSFAATGSKLITDRVLENGFHHHPVVATALVNLFGKLGRLDSAKRVFDSSHAKRDVVSWNSMLSACSQNEQGIQGTWELFQRMNLEGFQPDRVTFVTLLDCCASFADHARGRQVHECVVASGMDFPPTVANCVVNMYGKCEDLKEARRVFESLSYRRDVVSWNVMFSMYVQAAGGNDCSADRGREVFELRRRMDLEGVKPNAISLISMVDSAAVWEEIEEGEFLRSRIIEAGYGSNVAVCNSLINMYGKCHSLANAKEVFWSMEERKNEISWSSLVAAYAQNNQATEAVKLFQKMDLEGLKPDRVTLISLLDACGDLRASKQSSQIHARVFEAGLERDVVVANALVGMYGKLGRLEHATVIFETMAEKSVISWNTMVVELAKAGRCESALEAFRGISLEGLEQSSSSLVAVLFACSHAGLVEQGREIFQWMLEEKLGDHSVVRAEHYGCMVDLLGRSGKLDKAEELINNMPFVPDCVVWNMLLASSKSYGDVERGKRAANEVLGTSKSMSKKNRISSTNESPYVALANILELGEH